MSNPLANDAMSALSALAQAKGQTRNLAKGLCDLPEANSARAAIKAAIEGGCDHGTLRNLVKAAFGGDLAGQAGATVADAALFPAMDPQLEVAVPGFDWEEQLERSMTKALALAETPRPVEKAQVGAYTRTHQGRVIQVHEYQTRRKASMDATRGAHGLSDEAIKTRKPEAHQKAAEGHMEALRLHTEAHELSPADVTQDHKELMDHHRAAARWHADKAKGATAAYGTEKVEAHGPERGTQKAHHEASTRVVNGKVVQVGAYDDHRVSPLHTSDDENPRYALQTHETKHLAEAARGERDLNLHAKAELAARGQDSNGKWIGFDKAEAHHGVKSMGGEVEGHGHFQTMHMKVLAAAAQGKVDLNQQAKQELATRGVDSNGKWVGFEAAEKHHGIRPAAKSWDESRRDELKAGKIKGGFAGPHESFPIAGPEDVAHAWDLAGHAENPEEVREGIRRIAKEHGWEHSLPGTAKGNH